VYIKRLEFKINQKYDLMATLNMYASRIANIIGKIDDLAVKTRAVDAIKNVFAARIRQSIAKNGIDDGLILTCSIPVIIDESEKITDFIVFKNVDKIPIPVRFNNDSPFTYVGLKFKNKPDDGIPFASKSKLEVKLAADKNIGGFNRFFNYEHGSIKLYIRNNYKQLERDFETTVEKVTISSIFENPEEVITYYTDQDNYNVDLPFPSDMLESILLEVLKTEFNYNVPETEVKA
jgi:hypothetical protein